MRRINKIITGVALAAGMFGSSVAMAAGDGYPYRSSTSYYYSSPGVTYDNAPGTTYNYYGTAPSGTYGGYYDNTYNPYWSYDGPLGQGSGHDMRIGR